MEHEKIGDVNGVPIRVLTSDDYRTCSVCGGNCEPDPKFVSDEHCARIAFMCPEHGVQSLVDSFEDHR
ncbi:hypothetical protein MUN78_08105 [Leucobacter allii]|uniref:Uncharacterized protein n=1 Tax=Leucobacter allii TaxID=2932247 RepID=A0ABY4FR79_9MICO|nr:hypothetical protein [Leucobacter allii]UOQ58767.1 hypothetical protein MUN78_08105 [Leucobacter allii]